MTEDQRQPAAPTPAPPLPKPAPPVAPSPLSAEGDTPTGDGPTGDTVIDAALRDLAHAPADDLDAQIAAGKRVHQTLQGRLADLGGA